MEVYYESRNDKENEMYLKMKETEIYVELNDKRLNHEEVFDDLYELIDNF